MNPQLGFFYLFAAILLFSALRVITAKNPVHAVLYLMLAFSQAAGLWLILLAEFLGLTLVLVYLGAVMVLFLFVVMMLDIRSEGLRVGFWKQAPLAMMLGAIIAAELIAILWAGVGSISVPNDAISGSNTKELGVLLFSEYLYPIQAAAVILLIAMIAAIALTLRQRKDTKVVDPAIQVRVRPQERVKLVSFAAKSDATSKGA